MLKRLIKFYNQYRDYVRVDLIMYLVLILLIILYTIFSLL